jgi:hypothetical protein
MSEHSAAWERLRVAVERGSVHGLIALLSEEAPPELVAKALAALGGLRDHPGVAPAVITHMERDRRIPVRKAGFEALAALEDPRALPMLEEALGPADQSYRPWILNAITAIGGDEAVEVLRRGLADRSIARRGQVAKALGAMGSESAIEVLVEVLLWDGSPVVSGRARKALLSNGSPVALRALAEACRQLPHMLSFSTLGARLRRLDRKGRLSIGHGRDRYWDELRAACERADARVLASLLDPEHEAVHVMLNLHALATRDPGDWTADSVAAHLSADSRPRVWNTGIRVLGLIGDERSLPFLRDALRSELAAEDEIFRAGIAQAARRIGGPKAATIRESLRDDASWYVQAALESD